VGRQAEHEGRGANAERDHPARPDAGRERPDRRPDTINYRAARGLLLLVARLQIFCRKLPLAHTYILTPWPSSAVPISSAAAREVSTIAGSPRASKRTRARASEALRQYTIEPSGFG